MSFFAVLIAQAGGGGQAPGGLGMLLPWVLIFLVAYFLILRPQAKRQKQHTTMLKSIEKGDKVVTTGGVHGSVVKVNEKENTLIIKVDENVKLTVDHAAIARKLNEEIQP